TMINLRGVREAGIIFMLPTYVFVASLLAVIGWGVAKTVLTGGSPTPAVAPPTPHAAAVGAASVWLLLRAFASGCGAMTGVEAVSSGVQAFREPVVRTAQRTLTIITTILMLMLVGIGYLVRTYRI